MRARHVRLNDWLALLALAALLALLAVELAGCAAVPGSLSERRQTAAINALDNANNAVRTVIAPAVPSPYREMIEGAGVVVAAGLTFWLKRVHSKVDRVDQNQRNGAVKVKDTLQV